MRFQKFTGKLENFSAWLGDSSVQVYHCEDFSNYKKNNT